jgi:hypothetical protein
MADFFFSEQNKNILKEFIDKNIQNNTYYSSEMDYSLLMDNRMKSVFNAYASTYTKYTPTEFVKNMNNRVVEEFLPLLIDNMKIRYNENQKRAIDAAAYENGKNTQLSMEAFPNRIQFADPQLNPDIMQRLYADASTIDRYVSDRNTVIPIESDQDTRKDMMRYSLNGFKNKRLLDEPEEKVLSDNDTKIVVTDLYNKAYNLRDKKIEYNIYIDSRDRDRNVYPNLNNYVVNFVQNNSKNTGSPKGPYLDYTYKDILSFEVVEVTFPLLPDGLTNPINGQPYFLIQFQEINGNWDGTNNDLELGIPKNFLNKGPVKIFPDKVRGNFFTVDPHYRIIYRRSNLGNLNRLTINILNPDGTPFTFPADNAPNVPANNELQHLITLRITTIEAEPDFVK